MDPDHESLRTEDSLRLFLWVWPAAGKGWLGIVHGYGEHSGRYDAFARWLSERGGERGCVPRHVESKG